MGSGVPAMENFEEAMHQLHWVNEEMQRQLKTNINMLVKLKDLMKMSVEFGVGGEEHVGLVFVETVAVCRRIGKMETANMKSKMNVKELFDAFKDEFTPQSDTSELMERIIDVLKSNVKVIEEVSPKIRHILEKVDKPASLLELGLKRVWGLTNMQQGVPLVLEELPVTLRTQVTRVILIPHIAQVKIMLALYFALHADKEKFLFERHLF